ncbi:hypothetical protein LIT25_21400 [Bacillus sp. F19]|nr:hypothetical protein LIT25_21400 [Bacillus sp. F19]
MRDVSKRQRDEKGRFTIQPNQSELLTQEALDSRWNKVVIKKIPDTHASYLIKQRLFTEIESEIALIISATLVLSIFI